GLLWFRVGSRLQTILLSFILRFCGRPRAYRSPEERQRKRGRIVATRWALVHRQVDLPPGKHPRSESFAEAWESFARIAICVLAGVVAALSSMGRGPFPARQRLLVSCPAQALFLAGVYPLYERAIVILFAPLLASAVKLPCRSSSCLQFTKRRMRTFITKPSAKNMNRTEDPP